MRWPAEWEPQAAVLIAWPDAETDWAADLAAVETSYVALAGAVTRFQPLVICVRDAALERHVRAALAGHGGPFPTRFVHVPYDDTWLRDTGPVSLRDAAGNCLLLDFDFDGWGGKYAAARDRALCARLVAAGLFPRARHERPGWVLEGGAIDGDGEGSVLTTWRCLHARHPELDRATLAARLRTALRAQRVLWLEHGELEGDDTDAHVDTLARFAPDGVIVHQACSDPEDAHHAPLARMAAELAALRTPAGAAYRLVPLPWPAPIRAADGRRLPASYANYLVINDAVLVPAYGDPQDAEAARRIGAAHPGRAVVSVPCRALIEQHGSLHCITMQLPRGALD